MQMVRRLLYVDPEETARAETVDRLRTELDDLELTFDACATLAEADAAVSPETVAVVTEYDLPDGTGFDLIRTAKEVCPDAGCLLYTDTEPNTIDTGELRDSLTEYVGKESVSGTGRLAELVRTTVEERTQASYPIPQTEDERLAAVRSYDLETAELQASLSRLTELAATHFDVPTVSINTIEESRQEYLARYGSAEEWEPIAREISICTFTILEDDGVMAVEDVAEDPRFAPMSDTLEAVGVRSYMGATLVTPSELAIGTFCLFGEEPRSFSATERADLRKLATTAMELIDLHTRTAADDSVEVNR